MLNDDKHYWGKDKARKGKKVLQDVGNLRYADDTTFMEKREELKSLLMKVKEENGIAA